MLTMGKLAELRQICLAILLIGHFTNGKEILSLNVGDIEAKVYFVPIRSFSIYSLGLSLVWSAKIWFSTVT